MRGATTTDKKNLKAPKVNRIFIFPLKIFYNQNKKNCKEVLSKNNRCSGCFCLQTLWNILLSLAVKAAAAKLDA